MSGRKTKIEYYEARYGLGGWRWRVTASNGKIIGASSESFDQKFNAKRNFKALAKAMAIEMGWIL